MQEGCQGAGDTPWQPPVPQRDAHRGWEDLFAAFKNHHGEADGAEQGG